MILNFLEHQSDDFKIYIYDYSGCTYVYLSMYLDKLNDGCYNMVIKSYEYLINLYSIYFYKTTMSSYEYVVNSYLIKNFNIFVDNKLDLKKIILSIDLHIFNYFKHAEKPIKLINVLILISLKFTNLCYFYTFKQLSELTLDFTNNFFILYFFYITIMTLITLFTYFLGIQGVYTASLIGILCFWLSQLNIISTIILNNTSISFNSSFNISIFIDTKFNVALVLNYITFSFLFLTTTIGLFAIIYSLIYFKNEPNADRFIILLNWFIISMSLLVISDNAILLYLGWELIGLTSFFLINFWSLRRGTMKASFKAFVFNKFSDLFLLVFIIYMILHTKTQITSVWLTFFESFYFYTNNFDLNIVSIFLLAAASIKSAQLFGHLWLPDSMEAPIPASALIHSATLVSAGVFLLLKFQVIVYNTWAFTIIGVLGSITALFGAIVSSAQTDVKKLLAYSTISHCGFLFVTIYLNNINLTLLYLYLHGFFKALTFFCVGNLVKIAKGSQDTRKMGSFYSLVPADSVLLIFCCINLGGLPLTVGFYFKHVFQVIVTTNFIFLYTAPFLVIAMLCGLIYSYRLIFFSIFDIKKGPEYVYTQFNKQLFVTKKSSEYFTNSNPLSLINFTILIIFALTYYYSYSFYALNYNINYNTSQSALLIDFSTLKNHRYNNIYNNSLLFLFYTALLIVIFIINIISSRRVFSEIPMFTFIIYFIVFSVLLYFSYTLSFNIILYFWIFCLFFIAASIAFKTINNYKNYINNTVIFINKLKSLLFF